jgi:hypothetical protein
VPDVLEVMAEPVLHEGKLTATDGQDDELQGGTPLRSRA